MSDSYPILHLYSPASYHQEQVVLGNRAGLEALRNAVNAALAGGFSVTDACETGDGEGYHLLVKMLDDDAMQTVRTPYTAKDAQHVGEVDPFDLWGPEYRQWLKEHGFRVGEDPKA